MVPLEAPHRLLPFIMDDPRHKRVENHGMDVHRCGYQQFLGGTAHALSHMAILGMQNQAWAHTIEPHSRRHGER